MNDDQLKDLQKVSQFVCGSKSISFTPASTQERYIWLAKSLKLQ